MRGLLIRNYKNHEYPFGTTAGLAGGGEPHAGGILNVYRPGCQEHFVLNQYRSNPAFIPEQGRDTPIRVLRLEL